MRRIVMLGVAALVISFATGCAFTTERINLGYAPQTGIQPAAGADTVVVKVTVADKRRTTHKVGSKKNGYGMETAPIISITDVPTLVASAIETELRNRGYRIEPNQLEIKVELFEFENVFSTGFVSGDSEGSVRFLVRIEDPESRPLFSEQVLGQFKHSIQIMNGDNAKQALEGALADAISSLTRNERFFQAIHKAAEARASAPPAPQPAPAPPPPPAPASVP